MGRPTGKCRTRKGYNQKNGRKYKKVDSTRTINHTRNRRQTNTDRMKLKRLGFLAGVGRMHKIPTYSQIAQMTENERLEAAAAVTSYVVQGVTTAFGLTKHQLKRRLQSWASLCDKVKSSRGNVDLTNDDDWDMLLELRHSLDTRSISGQDVHAVMLAIGMTNMTNDTKKLRKALDYVIKSKIKFTSDEYGTHCDPEDVMRMMIKYHATEPGDFDFDFSGDGRQIAKKTTTLTALKLVRLEGHRATAVTSLWPVSLLSGSEKYDFLEKATENLRGDLERIQRDGLYVHFEGTDVDDADVPRSNCTVRLWLSADLKFINIVTGLVPSNCSQSCCYCHGGTGIPDDSDPCCTGGSRHDPTITWVIDRKADEEIGRGRARKNLFHFIPTERLIVDLLHMFLRISDRLVAETCALALVHEFDNDSPGAEDDDTEAEWLTKTIGEEFGKIAKCEVSIVEGEKGGGWKTSRLNGNKKRLIMTHFEMNSIFKKNVALGVQLQVAWDGFWNLYRLLNQSDPLIHIVNQFRKANKERELDIEDLPEDFDLEKEGALAWECLAQGWILECVTVKMDGVRRLQPPLPTTFITPYVHIFVFHVGEVLRNVRSLADFSCQSLELCNNLQGASWYRQNSKRAKEEAEQILLQSYRNLLNIPPSVTSVTFRRLYYCPFCPPSANQSNITMNMLLRHVRGEGCVGTIDMVTAEVRTAVTEDSFHRYARRAREVVGQVRDVQNEAREHMLIGQTEERRITREVRQKVTCDKATARSYRANALLSQTISTKLRTGDDERKSRAIGRCKLIPDAEQRAEWLAMAIKYGELWPEGCKGPARYTPPAQLTIELDTDETDT